MNLKTQNAKNIISKDNNLSKCAASNIVNNCDLNSFRELCENSAYFFDFVSDKVVNNLIAATNRANISKTFELAKVFDTVFGRFIISSWLNFADDDLSDDILALLENGSNEQKIYAAKYFSRINDSLALEFLKSNAFSENDDLSCACAEALLAFGDESVRSCALDMFLSNDDFAKYRAMKFLVYFSNPDDLKLIIKEFDTFPFSLNIAQEILYKYNYEQLSKILDVNDILRLYDEIISSYPEDISLDTVYDFDLLGFVRVLTDINTSYAQRMLADIKFICELVNSNNIYTYDLNPVPLKALKALSNELSGFVFEPKLLTREFLENDNRIIRVLGTFAKLKACNIDKEISDLYCNTSNPLILCECARVAKNLGIKLDIKYGLGQITDRNALELFKSYF